MNELRQESKRKITEEDDPFDSIMITRKFMVLKGVGRLCACGCNQTVIGPPHKRFVSPKHKDDFKYKVKGKQPSSKTVQALVAINVNYDGSRNLTLYFKKGVKREIRIQRNNCVELWETLNQISEFRNKKI